MEGDHSQRATGRPAFSLHCAAVLWLQGVTSGVLLSILLVPSTWRWSQVSGLGASRCQISTFTKWGHKSEDERGRGRGWEKLRWVLAVGAHSYWVGQDSELTSPSPGHFSGMFVQGESWQKQKNVSYTRSKLLPLTRKAADACSSVFPSCFTTHRTRRFP